LFGKFGFDSLPLEGGRPAVIPASDWVVFIDWLCRALSQQTPEMTTHIIAILPYPAWANVASSGLNRTPTLATSSSQPIATKRSSGQPFSLMPITICASSFDTT